MKQLLVVLCLLLSLALPASAHRGVRFTSNSYTTAFAGTENPLLQAGRWVCGLTSSGPWQNMRITPALAFGTQSGVSGTYDDSLCVLTGTWANDTTITSTLKVTNQQTGNCFEEVEHYHRASLSTSSAKGYEINFSTKTDDPYVGIVIWLGPGNCSIGAGGSCFSQLGANCTGTVLHDNDVIKTTIVGNVITAFVNGVQQCQRTDSGNLYPTGNPGIGHWLHNTGGSSCSGASTSDYGHRNYTVTAQ